MAYINKFNPNGISSYHDLWPESMLKPMLPYKVIVDNSKTINKICEDPVLKFELARILNSPDVVRGFKNPRGCGKSRALLSRQTGIDCFDLEPGHIPEIIIPQKEEPKNIVEELEELFVKQNEHIKVLMLSGAGKDDIKPLAILDYKSKTSEAINGYDLTLALDCLVPNLTKEGLKHFIKVANEVLNKKTVKDNSSIKGINGQKNAPYFNGYKPNFYFKQQGETK